MTTSALTIRLAGPTDAPALAALAALDSRRALTGDVLVADISGRPVAAVSLADGREVADPFARTAAAVAMLRVRAAQLRAAPRAVGSVVGRFRLRAASG